jgi:hypothetical protein
LENTLTVFQRVKQASTTDPIALQRVLKRRETLSIQRVTHVYRNSPELEASSINSSRCWNTRQETNHVNEQNVTLSDRRVLTKLCFQEIN